MGLPGWTNHQGRSEGKTVEDANDVDGCEKEGKYDAEDLRRKAHWELWLHGQNLNQSLGLASRTPIKPVRVIKFNSRGA